MAQHRRQWLSSNLCTTRHRPAFLHRTRDRTRGARKTAQGPAASPVPQLAGRDGHTRDKRQVAECQRRPGAMLTTSLFGPAIINILPWGHGCRVLVVGIRPPCEDERGECDIIGREQNVKLVPPYTTVFLPGPCHIRVCASSLSGPRRSGTRRFLFYLAKQLGYVHRGRP